MEVLEQAASIPWLEAWYVAGLSPSWPETPTVLQQAAEDWHSRGPNFVIREA